MKASDLFLSKKLQERSDSGILRKLKTETGLVDFCSNDYLGFARSAELRENIEKEIKSNGLLLNGSTGSRLLSGNSAYAEALEKQIADTHYCEAALIFNSGYDANVGLFSSLAQRGDTIITDELVHASIIDGARLSYANRYIFKHNDLQSLEEKLKHAKGNCYVAIESVYSMDGDTPPISAILEITESHGASLIVDEAHALGLYQFGLINAELASRVFARVVTFGKALGCHGAAVLGGCLLRDYLINFARPFVYTTASSYHQLASIKMAYDLLGRSSAEIERLKSNINLFKTEIIQNDDCPLIASDSAIQCIVLKSNEKAKALASALQNTGLDVRPILSPTVSQGSERIRICLHSFNSAEEITLLAKTINIFLHA